MSDDGTPQHGETRTIWLVEKYPENDYAAITSEVVTYDATNSIWWNRSHAVGYHSLEDGDTRFSTEAEALRNALLRLAEVRREVLQRIAEYNARLIALVEVM